MKKRLLVLENGCSFLGDAFGAEGESICEIVFNTQMVGYQEILSDPAYCGQMVVMSYPLIGNYGLADEDYESHGIYLGGLIVREYNDQPSNFRASKTLAQEMEDNGVVGISGVDTREIVSIIRDQGTMKAMICDADKNVDEAVSQLKKHKCDKELVAKVSSKRMWYSRTRNPEYTVAIIDCGVKLTNVKSLNNCGCNVIVFPYDVKEEEILKYKPDGIFVSSGPSNPEYIACVSETVKAFVGKIPLLGIGLGHLIVASCYGAKIKKLKFGHRGANQAVKNLLTDKVEITCQAHSYTVDKNSLKESGLSVTHVNLLDGEIEGLIDNKNKVISVQYYPDFAQNVADAGYVYGTFISFMKACGGRKNAKKNRY